MRVNNVMIVSVICFVENNASYIFISVYFDCLFFLAL